MHPRVNHDYKKMANPDARNPGERFREERNVSRPTISSSAKKAGKSNLAYVFLAGRMEGTHDDSPTLEDALNGPENQQWKAAIQEELNQLSEMGTWELQDLPEGRKAIGSRWVLLKKRDEHGDILKFKARLVAQGFSQKPGTDYQEMGTFAPVMRFETLRAMLALTAVNNWEMRQMDVKGAYLNGYLDEEIYMQQPPGFGDGSGRVCRLRRSLYGLKQAGNVWNRGFSKAMEEIGFRKLKNDYSCFIWQVESIFAIVLVWVDDLISFTNKKTESDLLEHQLKQKFDVKVLGEPSMLLGMKISRDKSNQKLTLSQTHYIESLLRRSNANLYQLHWIEMFIWIKKTTRSQIQGNQETRGTAGFPLPMGLSLAH
jgi:hypothetical protein